MDNKNQLIHEKLRQIKKLTKEVELLLDKGEQFIIRAALGEKRGYVDIYDPINMKTNLVALFKREEEFEKDLRHLSAGIYQSIKMIPLTAAKAECFKLKISGVDDWLPEVISHEEFEEEHGEQAVAIRAYLLSILDQYSVKPEILFFEEQDDMEEEYDALHPDRE
jgi:hypothetical protein